jgi:hypothetical protein
MPNSPRAEIPAIIIVMAPRPHKIHKRPVKNLSELKDPLKQSIKLTRRRALGQLSQREAKQKMEFEPFLERLLISKELIKHLKNIYLKD